MWRGLHGYQLSEGAAGSRLQSNASRLADACYFTLTTTTSYFSHIIARVQIYFTFIISTSYFSQFITRVQATSPTSLLEDKASSHLSSLEYKLEVIVTRRTVQQVSVSDVLRPIKVLDNCTNNDLGRSLSYTRKEHNSLTPAHCLPAERFLINIEHSETVAKR